MPGVPLKLDWTQLTTRECKDFPVHVVPLTGPTYEDIRRHISALSLSAGDEGDDVLHRALRHARPLRAGELRVLRQAHRQDIEGREGSYGIWGLSQVW